LQFYAPDGYGIKCAGVRCHSLDNGGAVALKFRAQTPPTPVNIGRNETAPLGAVEIEKQRNSRPAAATPIYNGAHAEKPPLRKRREHWGFQAKEKPPELPF